MLEAKGYIRVMLVEDSDVLRELMANMLNSDPRIMLVGMKRNGKEAVDAVETLKPDIIVMDVHMPVMDGAEATKQIMAYMPTPILLMTGSAFNQFDFMFKAISFGALDVMNKDALNKAEFVDKVKFLSTIKVIHHPLAKIERKKEENRRKGYVFGNPGSEKIIAIAASTGGPIALREILKEMPADLPCGIVIVQHIGSEFDRGLADWLGRECRIQVKLAEHEEQVAPHAAYIGPTGKQMRVRKGGTIELSDEPPYGGFRPSADILLKSVARAYGDRAIGVILTGMGKDGADGMKAIATGGGHTIIQDEASCVVFGMAKAALDLGVTGKVTPLKEIGSGILAAL